MLKSFCGYSLIGAVALLMTGCLSDHASSILSGSVSGTSNPMVAAYTVTVPDSAQVSVEFGKDTTYGRATSQQAAPAGGGQVTVLVAGMESNTLYHMRAVAQFSDGSQQQDTDQTFQTGDVPAAAKPTVTTSVSPGQTPQPGVELLDLALGKTQPTVAVSDLQGKIIWTYDPGLGLTANPVKLMPNGHFLINLSDVSFDGKSSVLQEVALDGTLVSQMKNSDLNAALASAGCPGCKITVTGTHHDFVLLPNGHLVVIAGLQQVISGQNILGDVIIDLDQNRKPVWLWNSFDHLDTNRHPMGLPDWLHSNALLYTDDGNLLLSMRHQNWIIKIAYNNGAGDGHIIWKLGEGGDFTLVNGVDPTDWFYAQHGENFASSNSSGKFSLAVFDNGNDRTFASGITCGTAGNPPCFYSTAAILAIDETAKTATYTYHPSVGVFSFFGGNVDTLVNGNVEYCEAASGPGTSATVVETTPGNAPVWKMTITNQFAYRALRIPSLYPGVQWTQ